MDAQDHVGTRGGTSGKPPARPGRKFGPLRDRSQEYNALARFLRKRMEEAGLTVAELMDATGLRTSAISERLAGAKLDAEFVDAVVVACTQSHELLPRRARLRKKATELLQTAEERSTPVPDLTRQPKAVRTVVEKSQEELLDVYRELRRKSDELEVLSRVQQQSRLALSEATELNSALSAWVVVLANEVEELTLEKELAMTSQPLDPARLATVDTELASVVERHGRTATTLARAEQDRRLATELLAEAFTRTRRVRKEVRHLREAAALPVADGALPGPRAKQDATPLAPFGDDVDAALARAEAVSRRISDRLSGALTGLDPDAETRRLPEDPATDNADNAVTGANGADNGPLWNDVTDVPTPTFLWAEQTALVLLRDRDPHDPRFPDIAARRPAREVVLLADRLIDHHWWEGAVRLCMTLARSLAPEELARLVLVLLNAEDAEEPTKLGAQMLHEALWNRPPADVAALYRLMPYHQREAPDVVRRAFRVAARRPYADVVLMVRELLTTAPRHLHGDSVLLQAIVHHRPSAEVADLVTELKGVGGHGIDFAVFSALPVPPAGHTELLVRLRAVLGPGPFAEMLPGLYQESSPGLVSHIAELHGPWPKDLAVAAETLRAEAMPLIIRGTTLGWLEYARRALERRGLSYDEIFAPYAALFPHMPTPPAD
ncbi:hypothetical protein ACIF80_04745 [Streptomyces sp. NPDC085927]|uniref:hypothetical protein n=1 Tax=Streptomyces sp. NPDC085927 TaxID=3365738 RepID=UPI0037CEE980